MSADLDLSYTATAERLAKVKQALLAMQRHSWEQGVAAQAFLESGERAIVIALAREAVHRQAEDGRFALIATFNAVADPASSGEAVLFAAKETGDLLFQEGAARMLNYLLHVAPRSTDGTIYHLADSQQYWIDSLYMAPPFLAITGHPQKAIRQVEGHRQALWNAGPKLYSHKWDEGQKRFERHALWGVGNGWAAAGMARIVAALPPDMESEKQRLIGYIRELIDGALAYQREDGLFHDVVDDPSTFVETNLAQMLAYTIYRGIARGWLSASYRPAADRMRQAAHGKVDRYGLVQDVCGSPNFDRAGTAPEGQSFFILMEAALADLGRS